MVNSLRMMKSSGALRATTPADGYLLVRSCRQCRSGTYCPQQHTAIRLYLCGAADCAWWIGIIGYCSSTWSKITCDRAHSAM